MDGRRPILVILAHFSSGSMIHYRVQFDDKTCAWVPGPDLDTPEFGTFVLHYWRTGGREYRHRECQTAECNGFSFDLTPETLERSTRAFVKFPASVGSAIGRDSLPRSRTPIGIVDIDVRAGQAVVTYGRDSEQGTMNLTELRAIAPRLVAEYYLGLNAV
jgi:hypothetical protein